MKQMGMADRDRSYNYSPDLRKEIFHFQKVLRDKRYATPQKGRKPTSISGKALDPSMSDIVGICQENQLKYLNSVI